MPFYAILHLPSGGMLPEIKPGPWAGQWRGYTHTEPTSEAPPRFFARRADARRALTAWLKGKVTVHRHHDPETGEYDETHHCQWLPERRPQDMAVVPVEVRISQPLLDDYPLHLNQRVGWNARYVDLPPSEIRGNRRDRVYLDEFNDHR